jgi:hypothetical protein
MMIPEIYIKALIAVYIIYLLYTFKDSKNIKKDNNENI